MTLPAYHDRDRHRPTDPEVIGREMRRLYAGGLSARDISQALRIALPEVLEHLRPIFKSNTGQRPER